MIFVLSQFVDDMCAVFLFISFLLSVQVVLWLNFQCLLTAMNESQYNTDSCKL